MTTETSPSNRKTPASGRSAAGFPCAFRRMRGASMGAIIRMILIGIAFLPGWAQCQDKKPTVTDGGYTLRPNDTIRVDVYEEPDLSCGVRILKTGHASFPLIGEIRVGGLSVTEAVAKIRESYAKDYLVDPKVTLTVLEYAVDYISVIGAVRTPGQVPIPVSGNLDIATALATTGGVTETADPNRILLVKPDGGTRIYAHAEITNGQAGRTRLAAGDRLIVNQSAFVGKSLTIVGCVARQGQLAFPLNGRLDLVQAIAMAGGLTDLANQRKVLLNRRGQVTIIDYKEASQKGSGSLALEPGDILTVQERVF